MASTRSKNTPGNYCLEQKQFHQSCNYLLNPYSSSGINYDTKLAGFGFNPGNMPASTLSKNYISIESGLFGIGSTNLVNPSAPIVPDCKHLKSVNLIEQQPTYIPKPLYVEPNQRPPFY